MKAGDLIYLEGRCTACMGLISGYITVDEVEVELSQRFAGAIIFACTGCYHTMAMDNGMFRDLTRMEAEAIFQTEKFMDRIKFLENDRVLYG